MKGMIVAVACLALLTGCKKAEEKAPTFVKAHDIKQLMATIVQPQADVFWKSAGSYTDATGTHDLRPTTEDAWLRTRSAAATIAEMGNLLMTEQYAKGRGEDWMQFSKSLVEIGQKAEKAAIDRSEDAIFETGGTMYNVCTACHQVYPPAAGEVPANAADAAGNASNAAIAR
ncbi:MAG: hypothetical protein J7498_13535 [Sphingobium sp.]|nr:hypothetical protein [Sphingobium sp.]